MRVRIGLRLIFPYLILNNFKDKVIEDFKSHTIYAYMLIILQ